MVGRSGARRAAACRLGHAQWRAQRCLACRARGLPAGVARTIVHTAGTAPDFRPVGGRVRVNIRMRTLFGAVQVVATGAAVEHFHEGDRVLIGAVTACGRCHMCRIRRLPSLCEAGGWVLGNIVDGTQARPLPPLWPREAGMPLGLPRRLPRGYLPQRARSSPARAARLHPARRRAARGFGRGARRRGVCSSLPKTLPITLSCCHEAAARRRSTCACRTPTAACTRCRRAA